MLIWAITIYFDNKKLSNYEYKSKAFYDLIFNNIIFGMYWFSIESIEFRL